MTIAELEPKLSYRSGSDNLVEDFLIPCLERADLYRRAAGYFTSSGLALAARGVAHLASRGGKMRLVVSPHLEADDVEALQRALDRPKDVLKSISSRNLSDIREQIEQDRLNALAWLAAAGLLELRIAVRVDEKGRVRRGIYHEKLGIFTDEAKHSIAFSGSSNETAGGLLENFECVEVYCSWKDSEGRVLSKIADFEALWENQTNGLQVIEFSETAAELLERFCDPANPPDWMDLRTVRETAIKPRFEPPKWLELHDYQEAAIQAWSKNGGTGIFAMATGSGKTLTALSLAARVARKNQPIAILVICPFINLCNQWIEEMNAFGLHPIPCYEGRHLWEQRLSDAYQSLSAGLASAIGIVTTTRTFQSEAFQAKLRLRAGSQHHLLIADEVHNLGASRIQQYLPKEIRLRLGLSATPERHHDPEGTQAILDYFGGVIYEYSISRAIAEGRLSPYAYHPHLVQLTDEEAVAYAEITEKLGQVLARGGDNRELNQAAISLLVRRSRLLGGAENKISVLDQVLRNLSERPRKALFYCGDGRTSDQINQEETRQIERVARLLGNEHGLRVRSFTYRETMQEREAILRDLDSGFLDGVVAIRCLDEGIDLPDLRMGFLLASSTNPRQFVQRRGRLLRKAPGKELAIIHDFIIEPPDFGGSLDDDAYNLERRFFRRELERIKDFCNTAENGAASLSVLKDLRLHYGSISV